MVGRERTNWNEKTRGKKIREAIKNRGKEMENKRGRRQEKEKEGSGGGGTEEA